MEGRSMSLSNLPGTRISGNRYGGSKQRTLSGGVESIGKEAINPGLSPFDEHTKRQAPLRATSSKDRQNAHLYEQGNAIRDREAAELLTKCMMLSKERPKTLQETTGHRAR